MRDVKALVEFKDQSQRPRGVALPNPKYIAIHYAIARVLYQSGVGSMIEEVIQLSGKEAAGPVTGEDYETLDIAMQMPEMTDVEME